MNKLSITIPLVLFLSCSGITAKNHVSPEKYSNKLKRNYSVTALNDRIAAIKEPSGILTLKKAIVMALVKSPQLQHSLMEVQARNAIAIQAGLYENPGLDFEVENFGGNKDASGFSALEVTIRISQLLETKGKPSKRKQLAILKKRSASWRHIRNTMDIINKTASTFLDLVAAQEQFTLKKQVVVISKRIHAITQMRVRVGKISPIEAYRSKSQLNRSRFEQTRSQHHLNRTRKNMAAIWGSTQPRFIKAKKNLHAFSPVPKKDRILKYIHKNPRLLALGNTIQKQKAILKLAKAEMMPDISISGGFRYSGENRNRSLLFGLSIPVPLFNSKKNSVREAKIRLQQSKIRHQMMGLQLRADFTSAYQQLTQSYNEARTLSLTILPNAKKTYRALMYSYREGKHNLLTVLEAQQRLFEVRELLLESLVRYHKAVLKLERLIGCPISKIPTNPTLE